MTEKDLKKLTRRRLLELLLIQTERADRLEAELGQVNDKLQSKLLSEKESGSIAEAALKLNGIFEVADAAAAQYLENIKNASEYQENLRAEAEKDALTIIANAEGNARTIIANAEDDARRIRSDAESDAESIRLESQKMLEDAKRRCAGMAKKWRKK